VGNYFQNSVGKFNATTGAVINGSLVTGLGLPDEIAVDNSGDLFVANQGNGKVGKYNTTTGAAINASLVTVGGLTGVAVDGSQLFVNYGSGNGFLGVYDAGTGAALTSPIPTLGSNFITAVSVPEPSSVILLGLVVSIIIFCRWISMGHRLSDRRRLPTA